jgi:ribosomal protein S18 acetylase RimI-like enzyme
MWSTSVNERDMTREPCGVMIRTFAPTDQAAARRLILEGLGEHFGAVDETRNPDIDEIAANYVDRGHLFLVAEDALGLVGTAALVFEGNAAAQVVRVSVAPRWRRRGLAKALVMRLIAAGGARGLVRLWMETNDNWEPAIHLYRACGFTPYDHRDGNIYMEHVLSRNPHSPSA